MKTFLPLAIASAAALSASMASAHTIQFSDNGQYRVSIPYGDLNLASPAGVQTLNSRIKAASNAVCGGPRVSGLAETREAKACRQNVLAVARPQMMLALTGGKGSIALAAGR